MGESRTNVEIKARCHDPERVRTTLAAAGARYVGLDRQEDTYFGVPEGRLKLRRGNIENTLIFYRRRAETGPKRSDVVLYRPPDPDGLLRILEQALSMDVVVRKDRHIYFLDNVKVHVDFVDGLGHFVEIEAIGGPEAGDSGELEEQCREVMDLLDVDVESLEARSYSDMLRERPAAR